MEKLKPCPFCGGEPIEKFDSVDDTFEDYFFSITCKKCRVFIVRTMFNYYGKDDVERKLKEQVETL